MEELTSDLRERASGARCPSCAATVGHDAPWCTLCYADLRPAPVVAAPPAAPALPVPPAATYGVPALDPLIAPVAAPGPSATSPQALSPQALSPQPQPTPAVEATWPCTTCGADNPLTSDACLACGAGFLAVLREAQEPLLVLPVVGDLGALSRGQRLGLAAAVVLVVLVLVAALGLLAG